MSYGSPQTRRAAGGGSLVFLIILAIGGYLLFSSLTGPRPDAGSVLNPSAEQENSELDDYLDEQQSSAPSKRTAEGWDMTEVDVNNPTQKSNPSSNAPNTTTQGDWGMSEVKANEKNPGEGVTFGSSTNSTDSAPTKTTKGDWEIEEVKEKGGK